MAAASPELEAGHGGGRVGGQQPGQRGPGVGGEQPGGRQPPPRHRHPQPRLHRQARRGRGQPHLHRHTGEYTINLENICPLSTRDTRRWAAS